MKDAIVSDEFSLYVELLSAFVADHGHARVPVGDEIEGYRLGRWCEQIRARFAGGSLTREHIEVLERFPGWTWQVPPGERHAPAEASIEERACHIYSSRGTAYRVDPELRERLARLAWNETAEGYAITRSGGRSRLLQREVLGVTQRNLVVRFRNRNPRDCRVENLEVAHRAQRRGPSTSVAPWQGTSRFRGVSWSQQRRRWQAVIRVPALDDAGAGRKRGKTKLEWLGYFDSEQQAAEAYDRRAKEVWQARAVLNFGPEPRRRRVA